jgi:hypothetical protein
LIDDAGSNPSELRCGLAFHEMSKGGEDGLAVRWVDGIGTERIFVAVNVRGSPATSLWIAFAMT